MFNDSVSFNGGTRVEVIAVLANCGRETDKARRALVTWIRHKQYKGRSTEHILAKLRDIESKFIKDTSLHSAFRDARAETCLPRAPDLPLPSSVKRKSERRTSDSVASIITSISKSTGPSSIYSPSIGLSTPSTLQSTPPTSPLHSSRASQKSEIFPGKPNTSRPISLPQGVPHVPQSRSPRIQIPRDRSLQPASSSPIASSPEDSGLHLRYRYMSNPVGLSSRSPGLLSPPSASPSLSPVSARDESSNLRNCLSHDLVSPPPSLRVQIPHSRPQRNFANSPTTSSSEESDFRPRYRHMSQPIGSMSPGRRRVTPPTTSPPDAPLPPIPSDDQGVDSDSDTSKYCLATERPPTPVQSLAFHPSPVRPLPIQPIPSPVPGSDESDTSRNSLRRSRQETNGELLPSNDIVRQDSSVHVFHDDHASQTGIGPPPPYVDQLDTYSPPDMPTIGDVLDRAVNVCGGSQEVRLVISKCIEFHHGYEPPYWQTRLQACGLNTEAAKYLVDEMCKQVDWAASFGRAI